MSEELTQRQQEILDYIKNNLIVSAPTLEEIAKNHNISRQTAHQHVLALRTKKFVDSKNLPKEWYRLKS